MAPSALCAYTLYDIHSALTEESAPREGARGGCMFPRREKLALLLSACTVIVSVEMLLPCAF